MSRPAALAALAVAVLLPAAPAGAAGPACPRPFLLVTPAQVAAGLTAEQLAESAEVGGVAGLFAHRDLNGNGLLCQQVGSTGRAPGLPSYSGNYKDDRA